MYVNFNIILYIDLTVNIPNIKIKNKEKKEDNKA